MNKQELIKEFREIGIYNLNIFGNEIKSIPTETAIDLIEQLDEPEKVQIPQFVADWIETVKSVYSLAGAMEYGSPGINKWLENWDNQQTFALAWFFGYEVEEEKKFFVKIKCLSEEYKYLNFEFGHKWLFSQKEETEEYRTRHTRKQLEEADFGWVFDCPGIEIEEVE